MKSIRMTCKNCTHRKPFFKSGRCDIKGKRSKHPEECEDYYPKWEPSDPETRFTLALANVAIVLNVIALVLRIIVTFVYG